MTNCFFVSDLHGHDHRYRALFEAIRRERPQLLFMGGDILPSGTAALAHAAMPQSEFIHHFLKPELATLQRILQVDYPRIFIILGNDDARLEENTLRDESDELWEYIHARKAAHGDYTIYGYAHVPPTPFLLKDWERYDISRYVDPGCVSPEEGRRTVAVDESEIRLSTIQNDLLQLCGKDDLSQAVLLFHGPPYRTTLDRAALDGKMVDHAPMDVHVGSIAVRRFIEARQPLITLHGHVHESARLTGSWQDRIGRTHLFGAAHDGPELALIRFALDDPSSAIRELL